MEKDLGRYNEYHEETYAECARVCLIGIDENGCYAAKVIDGVLYIYGRHTDGKEYLISVSSTFDVSIKPLGKRNSL